MEEQEESQIALDMNQVAHYETISPDELLAALEYAGRLPPPELIHACQVRYEEIKAGLLTLLDGGIDEAWPDDDPRIYRQIHAGLLLIAQREPDALPILEHLLRDDEVGANLFEWFSTELPAYGPALIPWALAILSDRSAPEYAREVAAEALGVIGWRYPQERSTLVSALCGLLPPLDEQGRSLPSDEERANPDPLWAWIAWALADMRDTTSQPQIVALYRAGLMDETIIGDENEYLDMLCSDRTPTLADYVPGNLPQYYREIPRLDDITGPSDLAPVQVAPPPPPPPPSPDLSSSGQDIWSASPEPFVRAEPKVGRNDPCPCGSGRKYKQCCGKKKQA